VWSPWVSPTALLYWRRFQERIVEGLVIIADCGRPRLSFHAAVVANGSMTPRVILKTAWLSTQYGQLSTSEELAQRDGLRYVNSEAAACSLG